MSIKEWNGNIQIIYKDLGITDCLLINKNTTDEEIEKVVDEFETYLKILKLK